MNMLSVIAISDTGPLISAFQSESIGLLEGLFEHVHITESCADELIQHSWEAAMEQAQGFITVEILTSEECERATLYAHQIAAYQLSEGARPADHAGEAEAMVLAQRDLWSGATFLADERAARAVASAMGLNVIGFAGVLVLAADKGLITPDDVRQRLQYCRQQGTHYSTALIERAYRLARK
jgi:predicted nucleic acid-binding protein